VDDQAKLEGMQIKATDALLVILGTHDEVEPHPIRPSA
jgi:hypothetical protein